MIGSFYKLLVGLFWLVYFIGLLNNFKLTLAVDAAEGITVTNDQNNTLNNNGPTVTSQFVFLSHISDRPALNERSGTPQLVSLSHSDVTGLPLVMQSNDTASRLENTNLTAVSQQHISVSHSQVTNIPEISQQNHSQSHWDITVLPNDTQHNISTAQENATVPQTLPSKPTKLQAKKPGW